MSFQTPLTIKQAIDKIDSRDYLLPAIQREFVWSSHQIELLFDSLMRGFPISSFLFWNVNNKSNKVKQKYYEFLKEYIEYHQETASEFNTNGKGNFTAVLDGQQRLTALYIALKGTYAEKRRYARYDNCLDNFPKKYLYLDICKKCTEYKKQDIEQLGRYKEEEDEREYGFYFLTEEEYNDLGGETRFYRVGDILTPQYSGFANLTKMLMQKYEDNSFAIESISKLHEIVYQEKLINYYLVETDDYEKALNIFIRTNSGGEKLSYADLLISTIISNWTKVDARKEFQELEKEVKGMGFYNFSKVFIVRYALLIYSNDIRFKVNNLTKDCLKKMETDWNEAYGVKATIREVFTLLKKYGHTDNTITSYNALAPIVYYLSRSRKTNKFCILSKYEKERKDILKWLNIVILKKIFGGQSDSILKDIRDVIAKTKLDKFPIDEINKKLEGTRKSLSIDDETLDCLLEEQKDSRYAFPILALLYEEGDYRDTKHKDHLHPEKTFNKANLKKLNLSAEDMEFYLDKKNWNSILNLQLLYGDKNQSKNDMSLNEWVKKNKINCKERLIPERYLDITDFKSFIKERKKLLKAKLKKAFE